MPGTMVLNELLSHLMTTLGISLAELAQAVGASDRTVVRWLADETYPRHASRDKLDELDALVRRLDANFKPPDGGATWLHAPSGYFGGLRPLDALVRGRIDAVEAALDALDEGIFV
ncbi:MAG: antitoxin Xre/MbcA/ParS toxin-binding domain-containing protein [Thermomicrobiales bacterium]